MDNLTWKESSVPPDSSSSETGKETPPESNVVHFTVGDVPDEPIRSSSKEKSGIVRSYSQDTNMLLSVEDKTTSSFLSKTSYSENSLDSSNQDRGGQQRIGPNPCTVPASSVTSINSASGQSCSNSRKGGSREGQPTSTVDDAETLSTDSNSTMDNDDPKKRSRKILFAFKRNKPKVTWWRREPLEPSQRDIIRYTRYTNPYWSVQRFLLNADYTIRDLLLLLLGIIEPRRALKRGKNKTKKHTHTHTYIHKKKRKMEKKKKIENEVSSPRTGR